MATQMDIDFTARRYPERASFKAGDTAMQAANAIEGSGRAARLRNLVLGLYARGAHLTADEAANLLQEDILSIRPRVSELTKQDKLIDTGDRRRNSRGGTARVLRINPLEQL